MDLVLFNQSMQHSLTFLLKNSMANFSESFSKNFKALKEYYFSKIELNQMISEKDKCFKFISYFLSKQNSHSIEGQIRSDDKSPLYLIPRNSEHNQVAIIFKIGYLENEKCDAAMRMSQNMLQEIDLMIYLDKISNRNKLDTLVLCGLTFYNKDNVFINFSHFTDTGYSLKTKISRDMLALPISHLFLGPEIFHHKTNKNSLAIPLKIRRRSDSVLKGY